MWCLAFQYENVIRVVNPDGLGYMKPGFPIKYYGCEYLPIECNIINACFGMFRNATYIIVLRKSTPCSSNDLDFKYELDGNQITKICTKIYERDHSISSRKINFIITFNNAVIVIGDNVNYMNNRLREHANDHDIDMIQEALRVAKQF
jgi:hypothetical protein